MVDPIEEGFEVVVRIGERADSSMIAWPLRPYRLMPHSHSKRNKVTHLPESDKITVLAILESLLHAGKTSDSERTVLHRKAAW